MSLYTAYTFSSWASERLQYYKKLKKKKKKKKFYKALKIPFKRAPPAGMVWSYMWNLPGEDSVNPNIP